MHHDRLLTAPDRLPIAAIFTLLLTPCLFNFVRADDDDDDQPGRPGLVAEWSDGERTVTLQDSRPVLRLNAGQSPHPSIAADGWRAAWRGELNTRRPGQWRFSVELRGRFTLKIAGREVLSADSDSSETATTATGRPVQLAYGFAEFEAEYHPPGRGGAVLRLYRRREDGIREPVPSTAYFHRDEYETKSLKAWTAYERGRELFAGRNCVACHSATSDELKQIAVSSLKGPRLDGVGARRYRRWIHHWLKDPHAFRPQTAMPRLFDDSADDRVDLYAAAEYVASLGGPREREEHADGGAGRGGSDEGKDLAEGGGRKAEGGGRGDGDFKEVGDEENPPSGREAFARTGCIACHLAVDESVGETATVDGLEKPLRAINGLGSAMSPDAIRTAIIDPFEHHPLSRMPEFRLDRDAPDVLQAIVAHLAADRTPAFEHEPERPDDDSAASRYRGLVQNAAARDAFEKLSAGKRWVALGREVVARRGCVNCHELRGGAGEGGSVSLRSGGSWRAAPSPPIAMGGLVVRARSVRAGSIGGATIREMMESAETFSARTINARTFSTQRLGARSIHSRTLDLRNMTLQTVGAPRHMARTVARQNEGSETVGAQGDSTRSARNTDLIASKLRAPSFHDLTSRAGTDSPDSGCLAVRPTRPAPEFRFSDGQRRDLKRFLARISRAAATRAPTFVAQRRLTTLGCTACHARDARKSVFEQRILKFVKLGSDEQLRDLAPPSLSGVGEKLRPEWIHAVVAKGARARPWMNLRMPVFPESAVESFADDLVTLDALDPKFEQRPPAIVTERELEAGRLLAGRTGFNCVSCHDVRGVQSTGVRGPDLAGVFERVRHEWWERWLLDPQRISPGTRMPSVFFGGRSAAPHILAGDPQPQRDAMWAYLSQGQRLELPVMQAPLTAAVEGGENSRPAPTDRPILARGFMREHGGHHGIALGFPRGTHFGFDSKECRLATVWTGEFLELGGWYGLGRGGAEKDFNRVLGDVVWRNHDGPAIRFGPDAAQPPEEQKSPSPRFIACWARPDDAGFEYRVERPDGKWTTILDRPAPLADDAANQKVTGFRRRLVLSNLPVDGDVWVRVSGRESTTAASQPTEIKESTADVVYRQGDARWKVTLDQSIKGGRFVRTKDALWFKLQPQTENVAVETTHKLENSK